MNNKHLGSSFDDFLQREQLLGDAEAAALKRVIAFQIAQEMERRDFTKAEMARRMKTSRASLERLLDPTHSSVTLATLERAATVLGKKLKIELA
jgi:antitoxin HicB